MTAKKQKSPENTNFVLKTRNLRNNVETPSLEKYLFEKNNEKIIFCWKIDFIMVQKCINI